jgi:hypothetical protein
MTWPLGPFWETNAAVAQPNVNAGPANILLLGLTPGWVNAVSREAQSLGGIRIDAATTAEQALLRLANGAPAISHLLIENGFTDALLDELVDLTAGEAPTGAHLVVLGPGEYPVGGATPGRGRAILKITGRPVADRRTALP